MQTAKWSMLFGIFFFFLKKPSYREVIQVTVYLNKE